MAALTEMARSTRAEIDLLSRRFAETFETLTASRDVFADDAFFDLNMPIWRFQLIGPEAFSDQLKHINQGPISIDVLRTVPSDSGFTTEHEEHQMVDGEDLTARRLWLCEVRDGLITATIGYCSGEWDAELRARHAIEAPMVRP
jgi:hypothetical protein